LTLLNVFPYLPSEAVINSEPTMLDPPPLDLFGKPATVFFPSGKVVFPGPEMPDRLMGGSYFSCVVRFGPSQGESPS